MTLTQEQQQLVTQARPLILRRLIRYAATLPIHTREDVIADGLVGLCQAATTYDPSHGTAFTSYATRRSLGAAIDGLRGRDHLTRHDRRQWNIDAAEADEHGEPRPANDAPISLSTITGSLGDETIELVSVIPSNDPTPDTALLEAERDRLLHQAVNRLPLREQLVVRHYFWHGETLAQIGFILGVTESRVSQLRTKALSRLRPALRDAA